MFISDKGLELIKHYEGLHDGDLSQIGLQPKMCPAGIWTVGWGHALWENGRWLKGEDDKTRAYELYPNLTIEQADALLEKDMESYCGRVDSLNKPFTQQQFDSLVSFSFNVGFLALKGSTLYHYISAGKFTDESIIWAFGLWNKARIGGILKPLLGLTRRRKSEAILFLYNELDFTKNQ